MNITAEQFQNMKAPKRKRKTEESLQLQVSRYLKLQYPGVIFTSESSGLKLPMGLAVKAKKMRSESGLPDMIILEPRGQYCGLCLELKSENDSPYLKRGGISKGKHVQKQYRLLLKLMSKGYDANFAVGFDDARDKIDRYMKS